jgi:PAS domain S-box-containing protein
LLEEIVGKTEAIKAALIYSEEKFAQSFLKRPILTAIAAMEDGRFIEVDEAFAKIMGMKRDELINNTSIGAGFITSEQRS